LWAIFYSGRSETPKLTGSGVNGLL
jgi:hypothetical protein